MDDRGYKAAQRDRQACFVGRERSQRTLDDLLPWTRQHRRREAHLEIEEERLDHTSEQADSSSDHPSHSLFARTRCRQRYSREE